MFNKLYKILLGILPFHVILSVFFQYKLHIPGVSLYKEIIIFVLLWILIKEYYLIKKKPVFDKLDYLIFAYVWYLLIISIVNWTWIKAIFYWWRYDFEFLLIFLITKHSSFLLTDKLSHYLKIFLFSASYAIFFWILVRFFFWESILVNFGFSPHLSSWNFTEWVPIYHGIEGANVRRFQWIFDWPNQAAFFLIVYAWVLFHFLKNRKDFLFHLYFWLFMIGWLVFLTYSRSSLLWIVFGLFVILLLNIKTILKKHKSQLIWVIIMTILLWSVFYFKYGWAINDIVIRAWSSKGHSERMLIWFNQFLKKPLWQWLASSWPAYRLTHNVENVNEKNFIPESWFVQQLVEWWIIWLILFTLIIFYILISISKISSSMTFSFIAILVMNLFLHTFEASYVSLLLFMLLGLFMKTTNKKLN